VKVKRSDFLSAGMVLIVGALIVSVGVATPIRDDVDFLRVSAALRRGLSWSDLWLPWNGHRQVLPRLIASGLLRLSHGDFRILLVGSFAVALGTVPALMRILPTDLPHRALLSSLTIFGLAQSENWLWGYQLAWFLVNAGVLWAIALSLHTPLRFLRTTGIVLACVLATLSSAHGILSWVGVGIVFLFSGRRRLAALWFVLAVSAGLLVGDSGGVDGASPLRTAAVFIEMMGCVLKFPSAWIRRDLPGGEVIPFVVGVVILSGVALVLFKEAVANLGTKSVKGKETRDAGLSALLVVTLCFIGMSSIARAAPFYQAAAQSRYTTVTTLGFLSLFALLCRHFPKRTELISRSVLGLLTVASLAALLSLPGWRSTAERADNCIKTWSAHSTTPPDCVEFGWNTGFDRELKLLRS
jgi:hypothetical protein